MDVLPRVAVRARLRVTQTAATVARVTALLVMIANCAGHRGTVEEARTISTEAYVATAETTTLPAMPPFHPSDEATTAQLERALDEGKAVRHELEWVEREEAAASGEMAAGEYLVTYLITPADDYYDFEAAAAELPAHHTTVLPGSAHVAVVVRDAADGRMVQGLHVRATLRSEIGNGQQSAALPFGWHPILNRYGENMVLPNGPFTLTVHISMPVYRRHDSVNGNRFTSDVIAKFASVVVSKDSLASAAQRLARGDQRKAIELARQEGIAVERSLTGILREANVSGSQRRSGDYNVAVVVQNPRGSWEQRNGKLIYARPDSDIGPISHIEVSIRDATTGRLLPGLNVHASIVDSRKRAINTYPMPFMWHPWMNHYGLDVAVPGKETYTIRVRADAPSFRRYGGTALRKFNRAIDVEMRGVRFATVER